MGFMDTLKNIGDVAADAAKTAGNKAQDLAKVAQEKAACLKELNNLKTAVRGQKTIISEAKEAIADKVLAGLASGELTLSSEVQALADRINAAKAQISELEIKIEDLKATAAVKNPEMAREIDKAIAEIDKAQAVDITPAEPEPEPEPEQPAG